MRHFIMLLFTALAFKGGVAYAGDLSTSVARQLDVEAVVDSAMILADDYAEAITDKPEMAKTRLGALRRFYKKYSQHSVQDSICDRIFSIYVDNIERDNTPRANIFKECFLAFADKDNRHLGPLYATELAIAKENFDTATVAHYIPLLRDYSQRLGYDYDEDIHNAELFIVEMATRRPLNEELIGVWVSDDMLKNPMPGTVYGMSAGSLMSLVGNFGTQRAIDVQAENAILTLSVLGFMKKDSDEIEVVSFADKGKGFYSPQLNEIDYFNLKVPEDRINQKIRKRHDFWLYRPITTKTDNDSRWIYGLWGTEQLKKNNPEFTSALRQSIQETQATVAGHYSRSKYNFGDRLAANAIASGFSAITNGIISHFSVSKDKIYSGEVNLQLQHHHKLVGRLDVTYTEVRSDNPVPKTKERNVEVSYYRWLPEDNVFFITAMETYLPLFEPSKVEMSRMKNVVSLAKKYWKSNINNGAFYNWFNGIMFSKLRANAGESVEIESGIKDIFEI